MATIYLETFIEAPIERVFDLSRSIDLHKLSTAKTNEEAIVGRIKGLIEYDETVTWRAKHLGIRQTLTSKIVLFEKPFHFSDAMIKGVFAYMKHRHEFKTEANGTRMIDVFEFASPFGMLGKLADTIFLKQYMTTLLKERNETIKQIAESDNWKIFL